MSATIIHEAKVSKKLPNSERIDVHAKLYHLTGNARPYFSVTADLIDTTRRGEAAYIAGGCLHDDVLANFPELAPVVELHLADDEGVPTYAIENGGYWLGFSAYPEKRDLKVFAKQWRISEIEAREAENFCLTYQRAHGPGTAKDALVILYFAMLNRWQFEADVAVAIIRKLAGEEIVPTMGGDCRLVYEGHDELIYYRCTVHSTPEHDVIVIGTDVYCEEG